MKLTVRNLLPLLFILVLSACGGGGSLSRNDNGGGTGGGGTTTPTISISVTITNQDGSAAGTLSADNTLVVKATVTNSEGQAQANRLVTFALTPDGLAGFNNDTGTAATDANGVATIGLNVGKNSGSGQVNASIDTGEVGSATFNSSGTTPVSQAPASLEFFASSVQLASSGSDQIELIAVVKNDQNVLMQGVTVGFSANSNASIQVTRGTTAADGTARAILTTQNNPENRVITATSTTAGLNKTLNIQVVGTEVNINGPSSVILNDTAEFTLLLANSDGRGIPNQSVSLSSQLGNQLSSANPVTDATGQVTVTYKATTSGTDVITASALNASSTMRVSVQQDQFTFTGVPSSDIALNQSQSMEITWLKDNAPFVGGQVTFTATRGTLSQSSVTTDAAGKARVQLQSNNAGVAVISAKGMDAQGNEVNTRTNVEFVATNVDNIIMSASPASIGPNGQKSTITAVLRDAQGNLVKGKTVNFSAEDVSGGRISPASAVTDSNGIASTVYTSNEVTSENAIKITATEPGSGLSESARLTVAERALFISLGTGNQIQAPDEATYLKTFSVFVTDANSNPVSNVTLTVTGTPVKFTELLNPNAASGDANFGMVRPAFFKGFWSPFPDRENFEFWVAERTVGCPNEDIDGDAIEDAGEDRNGDSELTPGNVVAIQGNITTNANGQALIEMRYPKTFAAWVTVRVTVSTPVSGSESSTSQLFELSASAEDLRVESTPPNTNPFGAGIAPANKVCTNTL